MARSTPPAPPAPPDGQPNRSEAVLANVLERGMALHRQGRLPEARAIYEKILAAQAQHFDALHLLGMLHCQSGNPALAVPLLEQAIAARPDQSAPYNNLGVALQELGRMEEALTCYERLIALNPTDAMAHFNRGVVLKKLKRLDEALASYGRAIALAPDHADAHNNLGVVQKELKRFDEALASHERAIALKPNAPKAHNNRGIALQELKRFEEALASYDRAIALDAHYADAWFNRGVVLQELQQVEQALQSYDKAITQNPRNTDAWFNRGVALHALRRLDEALASYDETIAIDPDYVDVYWNQALALLLGGQFQQGWALYEWRWKNPKSGLQLRSFAQPLWLGKESLAGKTILLHAEQGLGDIIQFCRYAEAVSKLGATVVLDVPSVLSGVLQTLAGVHTLVADGKDLPPFDCHCPLLSLPLALKTELHTIPTPGPYLASDADKRKVWSARLGVKTRPRIGLVWSGSTGHKGDRQRSLTLERLLQYLPTGCDYVSLQKEVRPVDQDALQRSGILHFGDQLHDFGDTAALCDLMDLVISVDTSVAHLAGALGKPTWILLPWVPDWRWLLDRTDSPWYASATLYRQAQDQQWNPVLERLAGDIVRRFGLSTDTVAGRHLTTAATPPNPKPTPVAAPPAEKPLQPGNPASLVDQALALHQQGQFPQARALYEQVLQQEARNFDALHLLGVLHFQTKNPELAVDWLTQAIAVNPNDPAPYNNLGVALNGLQRFGEALHNYDTVLATHPNHAEAWFNRGVSLKGMGRLEEAVASFGTATTAQPRYADAWNNRGVVLRMLRRFEEALDSFNQAIAIAPHMVGTWNNRGTVLQALQRGQEALESFDAAIARDPTWADAHLNRGVTLLEMLRFEEALTSFERAIDLRADFAQAWINRGVVLHELRRLDEAVQSCERALEIQPGNPEAGLNKALALLLQGDYARGWALYELRWKNKQSNLEQRHYAQPLWTGAEPLKGTTILLHEEQGFGDAIQFCRYAEAVSGLGATVLLEVPGALGTLMQTLPGVSAVAQPGQPLPPFDWHCPLLSLPLALQTRVDTIPCPTAYLRSDANKRAVWEKRLGPKTRPRVGLVWSGSTIHKNDRHRSLPLETLAQYLPEGCDYISLQTEVRLADKAALECSPILHFGTALGDFADTAALCDLVDLVISVDTSVAHLAGALGRPTWILLSFVPDWRWLLDRDDSPWYASVTLYRQGGIGQWTPVLERLRADLVQRFGLGAHLTKPQEPTSPTPRPPLPPVNPPLALANGLTALVDQALALQRQGQWVQAQTLYRQVLHQDASHFDALHLLGVSLLQTRNPDQSVEFLKRAIAVRPQDPAPYNNLGVALNELLLHDEALANYDAVLAIHPTHLEAHFNRGVSLKKLGRLDEAIAGYDRVIALEPGYAQAHNNKGVALKELGRLQEALVCHDQAIALKPDFVAAWNNRGIVLQALARLGEALTSYAQAIALRPDYTEAWFNQGLALQALQRPGEALYSYDRALSIQPDQVLAHNNRGVLLQELQRHEEALTSFERAIALKPTWVQAHLNRSIALKELGQPAAALESCEAALRLECDHIPVLNLQGILLHAQQRWTDALACYDHILSTQPDDAEAHNNRGATLLELDRLEEAAASFLRAITIDPDYAHAHFNLSIAYKELGRLDASIAACEQATRIKPDYAEAWLNHALALLVTGQFPKGWELYEWRWKNEKSGLHMYPFTQPRWLGSEPLAGKTILLHAEQGLGDTIQFCRYAPLVSDLGATVLLAVPDGLYDLLAPLAGVHTLVAAGAPPPAFDCHCPLLSLPLALKTTLHNIPGTTPYLHSNADKRQAWSARLGAKVRPRVGLVWSGSTIHKNDRQRSLTLERLLPHLPDGFDYISLQKEVRAADQAALTHSGIRHFGDQLQDFTDTAALCDLVDLVISVDTSVAHLAAAMGRPTWVLLPWVPDWRWLMDRSDNPWYPSVTLYRQGQDRQWEPVLQRVAHDMQQRLAMPDKKSGTPPT